MGRQAGPGRDRLDGTKPGTQPVAPLRMTSVKLSERHRQIAALAGKGKRTDGFRAALDFYAQHHPECQVPQEPAQQNGGGEVAV